VERTAALPLNGCLHRHKVGGRQPGLPICKGQALSDHALPASLSPAPFEAKMRIDGARFENALA